MSVASIELCEKEKRDYENELIERITLMPTQEDLEERQKELCKDLKVAYSPWPDFEGPSEFDTSDGPFNVSSEIVQVIDRGKLQMVIYKEVDSEDKTDYVMKFRCKNKYECYREYNYYADTLEEVIYYCNRYQLDDTNYMTIEPDSDLPF